MKKKIYLLMIPIFMLSFKISAQQWIKMNPQFDPPGDYNLGRGVMLDKNNGWVVQELNKAAFQTTDGGLTWKLRLEVENPSYGDIFFLDNTYGWITFAGGDSTTLFKTVNGGITWDRSVIPFMYRLFFINDTLGFGGGKLNFYKTTDGGNSWNKVELGQTQYYFFMSDSYILNQSTYLVLASVWNGDSFEPKYTFAILKTTDGGNSWFQIQTNLNNVRLIPRDIAFSDTLNGVLTTWFPSGVYNTSDGGANWIKAENIPISSETNDLFLINNNEGWIVGQSGSNNLIKTSDGGKTWNKAESLTDNRLYSISFLKDNSTGFIFGSHNTILKYDNTVGVEEEVKPENPFLTSLQNYPNPFNSTTIFAFELSGNGLAELKVYDILGRELKTVIKGVMESGKHRVQFDAEGLSSGIYIGILFYESKSISRKILIMK